MPVAILTGKFRCHYVLRAGCAISMRLVISVNVRAHCGVCVRCDKDIYLHGDTSQLCTWRGRSRGRSAAGIDSVTEPTGCHR